MAEVSCRALFQSICRRAACSFHAWSRCGTIKEFGSHLKANASSWGHCQSHREFSFAASSSLYTCFGKFPRPRYPLDDTLSRTFEAKHCQFYAYGSASVESSIPAQAHDHPPSAQGHARGSSRRGLWESLVNCFKSGLSYLGIACSRFAQIQLTFRRRRWCGTFELGWAFASLQNPCHLLTVQTNHH